MFNTRPVIICGSGNSVTDGYVFHLHDVLKNHITIGMNRWFKFAFEPTFTTFVDWQFYRHHLVELEKQSLIIGKYDPLIDRHRLQRDNTILLPKHTIYYGKDSWKLYDCKCLNCGNEYKEGFKNQQMRRCPKCDNKNVKTWGFYHTHLNGLFSLTLATALGFKEIYLIGFDSCEYKGKTHFFQDQINIHEKNHDGAMVYGGVGKLYHPNVGEQYRTSTYNNPENLDKEWFAPYKKELNDIQIINVSPVSKINVFPKTDYKTFIDKIGYGNVNQEEVRKEIKDFVMEKVNDNS